MNPNTGEILAEASYPNFDLNDPRNLSLLYTKEQWDAMSEEDQVEAMNDLWRNFCVSDAYEPGSTAKPFTVAAGLETGTLTGNESYYCGGSKDVLGTKISCHYKSGHGQETIQDAIANSCNVALMDMAAVIGPENFTKYQHIFGFGEYTGIDLPGEAETSGLLYTADTMGEIDLATNSFGQNFNVTMTQMVSAFSSLVNGGYYYEPHVVKQIGHRGLPAGNQDAVGRDLLEQMGLTRTPRPQLTKVEVIFYQWQHPGQHEPLFPLGKLVRLHAGGAEQNGDPLVLGKMLPSLLDLSQINVRHLNGSDLPDLDGRVMLVLFAELIVQLHDTPDPTTEQPVIL